MNCIIYGMPEIQYDLLAQEHISATHPRDVTGVICSDCMQMLINSSQEKIEAAYQKAIDTGILDKAQALETFLEEGAQNVRETKDLKPGPTRKSLVRMVRPTLDEIRPKRSIRELDKGRAQIR